MCLLHSISVVTLIRFIYFFYKNFYRKLGESDIGV